MREGRDAWLQLALAPRIGPLTIARLRERFPTPEAVLGADAAALCALPGITENTVRKLHSAELKALVKDELRRIDELGLDLIACTDEDFPALLQRLDVPPPLLWVKGILKPADALSIAIVGPRTPSDYARLMARRIASDCATQGLTIVSGMAFGTDAEAHRGALDAEGRTLAVLGHGLGVPTQPANNRKLSERLLNEKRGALISIFSTTQEAKPGLFPVRNEVIAGLSLGTLVVEAAAKSGALLTAGHAANMGRQVMACPGDATRKAAWGANALIADGATLIQSGRDVLAALSAELRLEMERLGTDGKDTNEASEDPDEMPTNKASDPLDVFLQKKLASEPQAAEVLIEQASAAGHTHAQVLERLLQLEINGRIRQLPGRLYAWEK